MPGRQFVGATGYSYGFGGQLKDDEISGNGNSYTAEFWQYDPRLGRRFNIDQVRYAWQSSYACFNNNPIYYNDPLGLEGKDPNNKHDDNGDGISKSDEGCANTTGTWETNDGSGYTGQTASPFDLKPIEVMPAPEGHAPTIGEQMDEIFWMGGQKKEAYDYCFTYEECQQAANIELTVALMFIGGGGLANGIRTGITQSARMFAVRAGTDATAQFTANMMISGGDIGQSAGNINLTETGLAGFGVNPFSAATTSAAFQFSMDKGFQSTFNGQVSASQFLTQSTVGTVFGTAGGKFSSYLETSSFKGLTLGTYMRVTSGMGSQIGLGVSSSLFLGAKTIPMSINVAEEYIENK